MRNSFGLFAVNGNDGSVLWLARVLTLFCVKSQTDGDRAEYVFLRYMECAPTLNEVE